MLLSLLLVLIFTQNLYASEKAISLLLSYGFNISDINTFQEKYPELKGLDVSSESYQYAGEEFTHILNLKLYSEIDNTAYVIAKIDSDVSIEKLHVDYEMQIKSIDGDIRNNLYQTVFQDTDSTILANTISNAFEGDFTTTKGIKVRTLYQFEVEQYFDNGRFVKYGNILNVTLTVGHAIVKKVLQVDPETFAWTLLPDNLTSNDKPFYAPVKSSRVSSLFQLSRRHPITRRHRPHNGIDFVAASGTAVFPALAGEITFIGRGHERGKFITIRHDNGYETTYDHLKKFEKNLRIGDRVELSDQLGEVGRTGFSTGAHLHFGIMKDGLYVNPIYLLKSYCYNQKEQYENLDESID
jgi:murein DD-endopeptidase MepM/ murein hydrolase activator NlpD